MPPRRPAAFRTGVRGRGRARGDVARCRRRQRQRARHPRTGRGGNTPVGRRRADGAVPRRCRSADAAVGTGEFRRDPAVDRRPLPQGRRPGLGTGVDGHVRAAAVRRPHLDRALEPRAAPRRRCTRRRGGAAGSRPGVRVRHASHDRAVPAVAGQPGMRRRARRRDRARLRLRQRHPRAGGAEARRRARGGHRQ